MNKIREIINRLLTSNVLLLKLFWSVNSFWILLGNKRKHCKHEKIRVVFITQYIPAWNKSEMVYLRMKEDLRFETFLLCLPPEIKNSQLDVKVKQNSTFEYFKRQGDENAINSMLPDGNWFDLKRLNPDYVFYTRPYNGYMPFCYTPRMVGKYAKTCLIMYAYTMSKESTIRYCNIKDFHSYLYFCFSETAFETAYYKQKHALNIKLGLQRIINSGYPVLESIMANKNKGTDIWDFSSNSFRVIWNPRWTTDPEAGGSNFFKYKNFFLEFAKEQSDIDFLFRPHPSMLNHFIQTGEMTVKEARKFREDCESTENILLDESDEYISTIWQSSVLISDVSSFMIEYFVTGKPIIFCQSHMTIEFIDEVKKLVYEGCYVANDEKDIRKYIRELKSGNDYLKRKRTEIISDVFGDDIENISEQIIDNIIFDHLKR